MKKKFMMVIALIGSLTLGACVSDEESASVEAVRSAKAEQLNSVAAMNNAAAAAQKALADANAALITAQANALAVQTQLEQIKVQEEQVKLQSKKDSLELQEAALEGQKANIALQLSLKNQQLQTSLLYAQADLLAAKTALANALKNADEATQERLKQLANDYSNAVEQLTSLQQQLYYAQQTLTELQADMTSSTSVNARQIANDEEQIAILTAEMNAYKTYSVDASNLKSLLDASQIKKDALYAKYLDANITFQTFQKNETNAYINCTSTKYYVLSKSYPSSSYVTLMKGTFNNTDTVYYNSISSIYGKMMYSYPEIDTQGFQSYIDGLTNETIKEKYQSDYQYLTNTDNITAQKKLIDALNLTEDSLKNSNITTDVANYNWQAECANYSAIYNIYYNYNGPATIAQKIQEWENEIASYNTDIQNIKENNSDALKRVQSIIDGLQTKITAQETIVSNAKAAITAAVTAAGSISSK